MNIKERLERHLRQLAPHVRERETGQVLTEALAEIGRLQAIAVQMHDRILRGDSDAELLLILNAAWKGLEVMEE